MTLREELEKVLTEMMTDEDIHMRRSHIHASIGEALTAIEKLIEERYVEKEKEGMYDCLDETCSTLKKKNALIKSAVLTMADYQKNYITRQEAYEIAEKWFSSDIPQEYTNEVLELSYKERCLEALRTAFNLPEGKE